MSDPVIAPMSMVKPTYSAKYNPSNWYWYVQDVPSQYGGGSQIYSSALASYIPEDDQTYQDWLAAGNKHTLITTHEELHAVLDRQYPLGTPKGRTLDLLNQGLSITSQSNSGLNGTYAIDSQSSQAIDVIATGITNKSMTLPGGGATFVYPDMYGNVHSWSAAQFIDFAQTVLNYVYAVQMNAATDGGYNIPAQPIDIDSATV